MLTRRSTLAAGAAVLALGLTACGTSESDYVGRYKSTMQGVDAYIRLDKDGKAHYSQSNAAGPTSEADTTWTLEDDVITVKANPAIPYDIRAKAEDPKSLFFEADPGHGWRANTWTKQ
ncbi:hypothetical protein LG274_02770 [Micrococcus antarcticus]|uniref:hypothetical protein n=1 Tax=Micrococcus antarcticus TaxID=86171 RepID=UPI0038517CA2